jgi:hypothetical protein
MIGMAEYWKYATAFRESLPYRILKNLLNGLGAASWPQIVDRHDLNIDNVLFLLCTEHRNVEDRRIGV